MAVLALDISGMPRKWVSFDDAITYQSKNLVAWSMGDVVAKYNGGTQKDGTRSYLETHSIIAVKGTGYHPKTYPAVALSNRTLFARDKMLCAYCGEQHGYALLSREHVIPRSKGGPDNWTNCVTACKRCNQRKGDRTPEKAHMELLYLPYEPSYYEHMILLNRNILADQMDYLISGVPKHSRLFAA